MISLVNKIYYLISEFCVDRGCNVLKQGVQFF